MTVEKITSDTFADQIATGVNTRDTSLDTRIGPIRDLQIDPIAEVLENQNDRVVYLSNLMSLSNADRLSPDDVDGVVFNECMVRWNGSSSVTVATFSRVTVPIVDITVPINFPLGSTVNPETGATVLFRTIETKTMYAVSASSYYNVTTGKYELDVQVASVVKNGTANVGAYTITQFKRPLDEFDDVTNKSATSTGLGVETNSALATRYLLHITGSKINTPNGLKSFILDNISSVQDAYIVYGNNTYLTREEDDAGAIDIWVLGTSASSRSYVTYYKGIYTLQSVDFQPIISISSVSSIATGLTYTQGIDYEVVTGIGEYAYSNLASDGIRWLPGGAHPNIGDDVVIQYNYNSLINILDAYFKQEQFYTMGADRLFRQARQFNVAIDANLKVNAGNPATVLNLVRSAVKSYINSLKLDNDVEVFDISSIVGKIYGVDNWTYNQFSISGSTGVSDILVNPDSYARISDADFVINLV